MELNFSDKGLGDGNALLLLCLHLLLEHCRLLFYKGLLSRLIFIFDSDDRNNCNGKSRGCVVSIWCFGREFVLRIRQQFIHCSIASSNPFSGIQFPLDCEILASSRKVLCPQYGCQSPVDILCNHATIVTGLIRIVIPSFCGIPALGTILWHLLEISTTSGIHALRDDRSPSLSKHLG